MENKLLTLLMLYTPLRRRTELARRIQQRLTADGAYHATQNQTCMEPASDVVLITYADSFSDDGHELR